MQTAIAITAGISSILFVWVIYMTDPSGMKETHIGRFLQNMKKRRILKEAKEDCNFD